MQIWKRFRGRFISEPLILAVCINSIIEIIAWCRGPPTAMEQSSQHQLTDKTDKTHQEQFLNLSVKTEAFP